jgi:hypothetical protein
MSKIDFVRELRLRKWAREHFVAVEFRKPSWHPIVLDEMRIRDGELLENPVGSIEPKIEFAVSSSHSEVFNSSIQEAVILAPHTNGFDDRIQGTRIVPILPNDCWRVHTSSEIQGPHWQHAVTRSRMSTFEQELSGYY